MNSVLTPLLAMTAWFLGLSILVQVLQELWKFSTSSKSRAFEAALSDFLGPFVVGRLRQNPLLTVRGPLQFRRVSIAGHVQPLNADDLVAALQKTAPEWQQIVAEGLRRESELQNGVPTPPSRSFVKTVERLREQLADAARVGSSERHRHIATEAAEAGDARRVLTFLEDWKVPGEGSAFDAALLSRAFAQEFLPQSDVIRRHYDQFLSNFNYQYRRRNLRQTFLFSMLVAIVLNLPFDQIFLRATALTPDQAVAMAQNAQELYARAETSPADADQLRQLGQDAIDIAQAATLLACQPRGSDLASSAARTASSDTTAGQCESALSVEYFLDPALVWERLRSADARSPRFLFGCFITAVLITFGAPFWNDLNSALLRVARPSRDQQFTSAPERTAKDTVE